MGYELATEAVFRGADDVVLITAAKNTKKIFKGKTFFVDDTSQMKEKVLQFCEESDIIIMAAAVSDIIPKERFDYKLKKNKDLLDNMKFIMNENILDLISDKKKKNQVIVGFAAESAENIENAKEKIRGKNIDILVLNDISRNDIGFDSDFNEIHIIDKKENVRKVPRARKRIIAREIINSIIK